MMTQNDAAGVPNQSTDVDAQKASRNDVHRPDRGRGLEQLLEEQRDRDGRQHDREEDDGADESPRPCGARRRRAARARSRAPPGAIVRTMAYFMVKTTGVPRRRVLEELDEVVEADEREPDDRVAVLKPCSQRPDDRHEHDERCRPAARARAGRRWRACRRERFVALVFLVAEEHWGGGAQPPAPASTGRSAFVVGCLDELHEVLRRSAVPLASAPPLVWLTRRALRREERLEPQHAARGARR